ncbi:hypothetical protein E4U28_007171, partial [Claviceps purpurea]
MVLPGSQNPSLLYRAAARLLETEATVVHGGRPSSPAEVIVEVIVEVIFEVIFEVIVEVIAEVIAE